MYQLNYTEPEILEIKPSRSSQTSSEELPTLIYRFCTDDTSIVKISYIHVPVDYRGQGIGTQLIQKLLDKLADTEINTIILLPVSFNSIRSTEDLISWYKVFGFCSIKRSKYMELKI
jgi:ribosomal protein S18 acetylase RimI-like enzyme